MRAPARVSTLVGGTTYAAMWMKLGSFADARGASHGTERRTPYVHNDESTISSSHRRYYSRSAAGRVRIPSVYRESHRQGGCRCGACVRHDALGAIAPRGRRGLWARGARLP